MRLASAFRLAFTGMALTALFAAAACGSEQRASFAEPTAEDAGRKKDAATSEPEPGDDADAPAPDADVFVWPTCNAKPASATARTIPEIWQAAPSAESETWIAGAYVTAISLGSCTAGKACQIFLQQDPSYASLAAAAKHGIKLFVSGNTAQYFTNVAVGDRVDVLGWAWRYNLDGQNELLVQVNAKLPGCAKTTSKGNALTPVSGVTLADLTLDKYESTHGPLFVKVANVSGKPDIYPTMTFGLWPTNDGGSFDAGSDAGVDIVSLSPFFLPGGSFSGLTAGMITKFSSITGVFGLFVPSGGPKYLELYPSADDEIVVQP